MAVQPLESLPFESWKQLAQWLPHANEGQLLTVFVWASDLRNVPAGEERSVEQIRKDAFQRLVERTREPVRRFLMRRHNCRDVHLAEDVVQEVLIQVYRRAEQFDPQRSFWGWLYRIARNKYIDALRRQREVGTGWISDADDALEQWLHKQALAAPTPETEALSQERKQRLEAALAKLPGPQQTIVRLKQQGVKGTDIARQLSRSQAYVSQAYHEAVELLRDWLDD